MNGSWYWEERIQRIKTITQLERLLVAASKKQKPKEKE